MSPIIFIDLETTGLNPATAAPISIAALVCSGPHHGKLFNAQMRPFTGAEIQPMALLCNGYKANQILAFADPVHTLNLFVDWLNMVVPEGDAVLAGGYNYRFDESFLREWFIRSHEDPAWYGNTFAPDYIEVMKEIKTVWPEWRFRFPNMKLVTQYEHHFGQPLTAAHNEVADVYATMHLFLHADKHKPTPRYSHLHHELDTVYAPRTECPHGLGSEDAGS